MLINPRLKTVVFTVGYLLFSSSYCFAENKTYTIGVEDIAFLPHFSYENDSYSGFAKELLDTFAKSYGYTFKYEARPTARLYAEYINGNRFDFKYPDNPYWQALRKTGKKVIYSQPIVAYIDGVMVLPERKGAGIENLKKLATMRGFTLRNYLDLITMKKVEIYENNSFISLLKMALMKRVDGAYINIEIARHQLEHVLKKPNALVFDPSLPYTKDFYALSSLKHPEMIKEFNSFLIQERKLIDTLKKKYKVGIALDFE